MFTLDQKARVEAVLANTNINDGMGHLATPANLTATGVADPYNPAICAPIADFNFGVTTSNQGQGTVYICAQDSVIFTDYSYNATPTGFNWLFTGGTPNTSTDASPTIFYNKQVIFACLPIHFMAAYLQGR